VPGLHALAYHRVVANRLDEMLVRDARRRLERWEKEGRIDPRWAREWEQILALRQSSPFAGSLTEHERRRIVQAVEQHAAR
jgi:hypothetical protein